MPLLYQYNAYYACTMPTMPVLCLLCLCYAYYAQYVCTTSTMPIMPVLCLLCLSIITPLVTPSSSNKLKDIYQSMKLQLLVTAIQTHKLVLPLMRYNINFLLRV